MDKTELPPQLKPKARDGVMMISPYVGGKSSVDGVDTVIKLSSNETPLGPSPKVFAALEAAQAHLEAYPDGGVQALREAIAAKHGLNAENIICGNGSDELFDLISQAYLGPGLNAVIAAHGFAMYEIVIRAADAEPVITDEVNYTAYVDNMLAAVNENTRVVFLANPNNPTGTYLPVDEVRRLHAGLPGNVILVLDAAYAEYVRRNDYEAGVELVSTNQNVVMTRTFSKIYGLAGLRLGWGYAPKQIIDVMQRVRMPFNVNALAQAAGIAALTDDAHIDKARARNDQWLPWLSDEIGALGLEVTPSVGNFVLVHFSTPDTANQVADFLGRKGLIVRAMGGYRLPQCLRITVGSEAACRAVVAALKLFLDSQNK